MKRRKIKIKIKPLSPQKKQQKPNPKQTKPKTDLEAS
jgi:hypothetical protein